MPVFLSHRKDDAHVALTIDRRLKSHGINTYLDVLDPALSPSTVTAHILEHLDRCTHLMAIVSAATANSWWVPFEVGVATHGEKRITSYQIAYVKLPEYLGVWPILMTEGDVDKFARRYLTDKSALEKSYRLTEARQAPIQNATAFHQTLKADLGQR